MQLFQLTRELKLAYLPRYTRYGKIKCQTACCRCSMKKKKQKHEMLSNQSRGLYQLWFHQKLAIH